MLVVFFIESFSAFDLAFVVNVATSSVLFINPLIADWSITF